MNKEQTKIWKDACNKEKEKKGYIPAEMAMIPIILNLNEKGKIDIAIDDESGFTFISTNIDKGE